MKDGIIYVATGEDYRNECCISAKSVKNQIEDVSITVFSDKVFDCEHIDDIVLMDSPHHSSLDAIEYLPKSPYERTIYFDTDIYVDGDINGIFDIIDDYDLAAVHDVRHSNHHECPIPNIPSDYPEYNTGVIAYKKNESVIEFFERWREIFKMDPETVIDQPSFRAALYESKLKVVTLPPEYNCLYSVHPGYLNGRVKIFHGRLTSVDGYKGLSHTYDPQEVRDQLNSTLAPRAYTPYNGFKILSQPENVFGKVVASYQKNGAAKTIFLIGDKIMKILFGFAQ